MFLRHLKYYNKTLIDMLLNCLDPGVKFPLDKVFTHSLLLYMEHKVYTLASMSNIRFVRLLFRQIIYYLNSYKFIL